MLMLMLMLNKCVYSYSYVVLLVIIVLLTYYLSQFDVSTISTQTHRHIHTYLIFAKGSFNIKKKSVYRSKGKTIDISQGTSHPTFPEWMPPVPLASNVAMPMVALNHTFIRYSEMKHLFIVLLDNHWCQTDKMHQHSTGV